MAKNTKKEEDTIDLPPGTAKYCIVRPPEMILCQWANKQDGYPVSTIRKMQEAGCLYCINGKIQERI